MPSGYNHNTRKRRLEGDASEVEANFPSARWFPLQEFYSNANCDPLITSRYQTSYHPLPDPLNHSMILDNPGQLYNYINKCRKWVKVWNPRNAVAKEAEFSLTTYNILSQNLLLNHLYLYRSNSKSDLAWPERGERLKKELIELNSDIFCLQEVHMAHFTETILPSLVELGYQAVFKQKTGANIDGCSILFKKSKFQLEDHVEVELKRVNISNLLDRDQIALIVKLRPIGFPEVIDTNLIVANTHLLYNPKRGDIKLAQLRLLMAEIQRFAVREHQSEKVTNPFDMSYFPIILCGDMNSEPHSPLVHFIHNGMVNVAGLKSGDISGQNEGRARGHVIRKEDLIMQDININSCFSTQPNDSSAASGDDFSIRHVFNLKSAYPNIDEFNKKLISMSTYHDTGHVDHIFYSYKHPNLRLSAFKQLMSWRDMKNIGSIPNSILGSDHMALSAKFYLL